MNRRPVLLAVTLALSAAARGGAVRADDGGPDWAQEAEIATPVATQGLFGFAAAIAGETVFIAAMESGSAETAVYAFTRNASGAWKKAQRIGIPVTAIGYATAIAADGDTLVVLDSSGAHVLLRQGARWNETQYCSPILDGGTRFPGLSAVALRGDLLALAVPNGNFTLALDVYVRPDASAPFEQAAHVSDSVPFNATLAIGDDGTIYVSSGSLTPYLESASDGGAPSWSAAAPLSVGDGGLPFFAFRGPVATSGAYLAAAGSYSSIDAGVTETVEVFTRQGSTWQHVSSVPLPLATPPYLAPASGIALANGTALVGASAANGSNGSAVRAGAALVIPLDGGAPEPLVPKDVAPEDALGGSVAASGGLAVIGASGKVVGTNASGAAYVYVYGLPLGQPCAAAADCASGFCVDGVCCNTACGGGADDCMTCAPSLTFGPYPRGTCGPADFGSVCRAASDCAFGSECDGVSTECAATIALPNGSPCSTGVCVDGACTSVSSGSRPPSPFDAGPAVTGPGAKPTDPTSDGEGCSTEGGGTNAWLATALILAAVAARRARRKAR